ncbi:MAG: tetratricopeptide repeat protein [Candidatus Firestonebacteria bacterium]
MEESLEKYIEAGDKYFNAGAIDAALKEYRFALNLKPDSQIALMKLGIVYDIKGSRENNNVFFKLAYDSFRKAVLSDPRNETLHDYLMLLASKLNVLGELTKEYKEKLKNTPGDKLYLGCLKKISATTLLSVSVLANKDKYKPSLVLRIFFDYSIFPSSLLTIYISFMGEELNVLRLPGIAMLLIFIGYKCVTFYLLNLKKSLTLK